MNSLSQPPTAAQPEVVQPEVVQPEVVQPEKTAGAGETQAAKHHH